MLKLQCQSCKNTRSRSLPPCFVILCPRLYFILSKYVKLTLSSNFRGASTLRSVATRRARELLGSKLIINLLKATSICQNLPLETTLRLASAYVLFVISFWHYIVCMRPRYYFVSLLLYFAATVSLTIGLSAHEIVKMIVWLTLINILPNPS